MAAIMIIWGVKHPPMEEGFYGFPMQISACSSGFSSKTDSVGSSPGQRMSQKESPGEGSILSHPRLAYPCPFIPLNSYGSVLLLTLLARPLSALSASVHKGSSSPSYAPREPAGTLWVPFFSRYARLPYYSRVDARSQGAYLPWLTWWGNGH